MPFPTHMKSTQQAVNKHWPNQYIVLVTNNNPSTYIKIIRLICDMCSLIYDETLLVLKAEYSRITWLMPWLLMPWLPVSPGHLQLLYCICRINGILASVKKGFNYLSHLTLEKWMEMQIYSLLFNSLWPGDASWWHKAGPKLAQVIACCLTVSGHYLNNQCWFSSVKSCVIHLRAISQEMHKISFLDISLKITIQDNRHLRVKLQFSITMVNWFLFWKTHWYIYTSMAYCNTAVSPLLMHWKYCSLALSHPYHMSSL